jgi:hypothetical protein
MSDILENRRQLESRYIRLTEWASELRSEITVGTGGTDRYIGFERVLFRTNKGGTTVPRPFYWMGAFFYTNGVKHCFYNDYYLPHNQRRINHVSKNCINRH